MLLAALACLAALAFDAGADLRIRQEIMDNVPGLPGGGLLNARERGGYTNHMRFRPRFWGELKANERFRLYARFTDEFRWYVRPKRNAYTWPDELIVDNLYLESRDLFDGLVDVRVGRQDIYALYGLDHVFVDGTPGDGSRTVYSDVARATFHVDDISTLDVFALYNEDDNIFRWGTDRGKHRSMTGLGGGAEVEMDDWGGGAVWSSRFAKGLPYQLFALQKSSRAFERNGVRHPWMTRTTLGAKIVPQLTDHFSLQLEGMGQVGRNGDGDTLSGASSYAGLAWHGDSLGFANPFAKLGYHYMSGDSDAASEDGGHHAWDPIWARGVNDSELFLYGTHYGAAWWSNQHYVKLTSGLEFSRAHRLTGSCGPLFAAVQDGLGGGNGEFKGFLSQLRYDFPLWLADPKAGERFEMIGHALVEFFNPGDYFATDRPAWFVRWQVELKF